MKMEPYRQLYFLYVWAENHPDPAGSPVWRYRLENAATHTQHLFADLRALLEFLESRQTNICADSTITGAIETNFTG